MVFSCIFSISLFLSAFAGSFEVTVTSVSLPPFVSRRGLSNTNQRLSKPLRVGLSHSLDSAGACGLPSAWPVLRRLPWPRRFLAKAIRGSEPGAQVLEPLHLTRILGPPPDVYLHSLLSFFVFHCLSVCEALKLRPLPFTHPFQ